MWSYETRIKRLTDALINRDLLEKDSIHIIRRPLFFGKYKFSIGITPLTEYWFKFDEIKEKLVNSLKIYDALLQSNKRTYIFYIFANDPKVLALIIKNEKPFIFNHLRLIDPLCYNLPKPKIKPKGKFYGNYNYRIRMNNMAWADETYEGFDVISKPYKVVLQTRAYKTYPFIYLNRLNDVLILKLTYPLDIDEIEDRSKLKGKDTC